MAIEVLRADELTVAHIGRGITKAGQKKAVGEIFAVILARSVRGPHITITTRTGSTYQDYPWLRPSDEVRLREAE